MENKQLRKNTLLKVMQALFTITDVTQKFITIDSGLILIKLNSEMLQSLKPSALQTLLLCSKDFFVQDEDEPEFLTLKNKRSLQNYKEEYGDLKIKHVTFNIKM